MDSVQIYDELPAQPRPRKPLANWISVRLGNNLGRPTVDHIACRRLQLNILNENNEHGHKDIIGHQKIQEVWKESLFLQTKIAPHLDLV